MDPLGPDSLTWRVMADARTARCGGRALLKQVAHPTVGAAVADHSTFRQDPWPPRFRGTAESALRLTYGGRRAHEESARRRAPHRDIKGTTTEGTPYHALDPRRVLPGPRHPPRLRPRRLAPLRHPLTVDEEARIYREWRHLGRILGTPAHAMPADNTEFRACLKDKTDTLTGAVAPPADRFPGPLWNLLTPRIGNHLTRRTLGTLPPPLRTAPGLTWSTQDSLRFARRSDRIRRTVSTLPTWARQYPAATFAHHSTPHSTR